MILYGKDHSTRAANLAKAVGENCESIATVQAALPRNQTDATLTIWGHGDPTSMADLSASNLQSLILAWRKANPALQTVELVTCDSRNTQGGSDSFTDKLVPLLIADHSMPVKLRTLPRGGSKATWSVLWAVEAPQADGYYFVNAESQATMDQGSAVLKSAEAATRSFADALSAAQAANNKAAVKGPTGYVTSSGPFAKLRSILVEVTTYKLGGKIVAVPK